MVNNLEGKLEDIPGLKEIMDLRLNDPPKHGSYQLLDLQINKEQEAAAYIIERHEWGSSTGGIGYSVIIEAFRNVEVEGNIEPRYDSVWIPYRDKWDSAKDDPSKEYNKIISMDVDDSGIKVKVASSKIETEFEFNLKKRTTPREDLIDKGYLILNDGTLFVRDAEKAAECFEKAGYAEGQIEIGERLLERYDDAPFLVRNLGCSYYESFEIVVVAKNCFEKANHVDGINGLIHTILNKAERFSDFGVSKLNKYNHLTPMLKDEYIQKVLSSEELEVKNRLIKMANSDVDPKWLKNTITSCLEKKK